MQKEAGIVEWMDGSLARHFYIVKVNWEGKYYFKGQRLLTISVFSYHSAEPEPASN